MRVSVAQGQRYLCALALDIRIDTFFRSSVQPHVDAVHLSGYLTFMSRYSVQSTYICCHHTGMPVLIFDIQDRTTQRVLFMAR